MKKSKYFGIKELVSKACYEKLGEAAWEKFAPEIIDTIDFLREGIGLPMTVNNWQWGGTGNHRGYRWSDCIIGAKYSAHKEGKAVDISVKGWTDEQFEKWIVDHEAKLPHKIRIEVENTNTKLHIDTRVGSDIKNKITFFKP